MFQTTKHLIVDIWKEPSHMTIPFLKFQPSIYSSKAADPARSAAAQSTGCFAPAKLIPWPMLQCLLKRFLTCNLVVSIPLISADIGNGLVLDLPQQWARRSCSVNHYLQLRIEVLFNKIGHLCWISSPDIIWMIS